MSNVKAFTKNQVVVMFRPAAANGKVWGWRRARVVSCGKVKMTIESMDGEMLGRNYEPTKNTHDQYGGLNRVIFLDDMSDEQILNHAISFAKMDVESVKVGYKYQIEHSQNEQYKVDTQKLIDELNSVVVSVVAL